MGASYQRLDTICRLPIDNLALIQVHDRIIHFASLANAHNIGNSVGPDSVLWILDPFHHLRLARLPQCDGIEENSAVLLADNCDGLFYLGLREGIERMGRLPQAGDMGRSLLESFERHSSSIGMMLDGTLKAKLDVRDEGYGGVL